MSTHAQNKKSFDVAPWPPVLDLLLPLLSLPTLGFALATSSAPRTLTWLQGIAVVLSGIVFLMCAAAGLTLTRIMGFSFLRADTERYRYTHRLRHLMFSVAAAHFGLCLLIRVQPGPDIARK